jgi:hypothetical protein
MLRNECVDPGAVPNQRLERQLPMPAHRQDHGHRDHDHGKRQEAPQAHRPDERRARAGARDRGMSSLVRHRQRQGARRADLWRKSCMEK